MIWKYDGSMNKAKTIHYLSNRINGCMSDEKNEIIIFDPYLRQLDANDVETFIKIFEPHAKRISSFIFSIGKKDSLESEKHCQKISNTLGIEIKIFKCLHIHDRFWMSKQGYAFVVGCSINSFGDHIFYIQNDHMYEKEKEGLLNYFDKNKTFIKSFTPKKAT